MGGLRSRANGSGGKGGCDLLEDAGKGVVKEEKEGSIEGSCPSGKRRATERERCCQLLVYCKIMRGGGRQPGALLFTARNQLKGGEGREVKDQ